MSLFRFKTIDEVIERANDSVYAMGALRALAMQSRSSMGFKRVTAYVNDVSDAETPCDGFKESDIGRENGELDLRNYVEHKTVIIKRRDNSMP
ncbi:unnamed protein product [Peronospora destructor]|uniref:Aldehyde dehydrogenase domain-containing protein n=1 Tax=Peronospora destructor TaxID=86335 RepID=A0AAV0UL50_9STRA|nr:unnamed protein product [Peronospora destructor]